MASINEAYKKELNSISTALKKAIGHGYTVKYYGLAYALSNRDGEVAYYTDVELNKEESINVTYDDTYDVQFYFRLESVVANETQIGAYGRRRNWLNSFLFSLVLSAKHKNFNQEQLYTRAVYAIQQGGGIISGAEMNMYELHKEEFLKDAFHIETQVIRIVFEIRKILLINCVNECY